MPKTDDVDEGPSDEDLRTFGGVTQACPACRTELYDDAELCWKCGHALGIDRRGVPIWAFVVAVLLLGLLGYAIIW